MDYFFAKFQKAIDGTDAIAPHGCQDIVLYRDGGLAERESEIGNRPPLRIFYVPLTADTVRLRLP